MIFIVWSFVFWFRDKNFKYIFVFILIEKNNYFVIIVYKNNKKAGVLPAFLIIFYLWAVFIIFLNLIFYLKIGF